MSLAVESRSKNNERGYSYTLAHLYLGLDKYSLMPSKAFKSIYPSSWGWKMSTQTWGGSSLPDTLTYDISKFSKEILNYFKITALLFKMA